LYTVNRIQYATSTTQPATSPVRTALPPRHRPCAQAVSSCPTRFEVEPLMHALVLVPGLPQNPLTPWRLACVPVPGCRPGRDPVRSGVTASPPPLRTERGGPRGAFGPPRPARSTG